MFDGGELYGSFQPEQPPLEKQQLQMPAPPPVQHKPPQQQQQQQEAMYYHEVVKQPQTESFFDRIASKRYEIVKVISFALIIVFAIAIDRVNTHYLTQYVTNSILTGTQELLLRISYPVTVLIIIWMIKIL